MLCQFKPYFWEQSFIRFNILVVALMHFESILSWCSIGKGLVVEEGFDVSFLPAVLLGGVLLFFHLILNIQHGWQSWGAAPSDQHQEHKGHPSNTTTSCAG